MVRVGQNHIYARFLNDGTTSFLFSYIYKYMFKVFEAECHTHEIGPMHLGQNWLKIGVQSPEFIGLAH